ncbi:MAG TPA: ornithine carbamoyltransferase [Thermoplasmata archaeon]|nr:ornithine carbamoyltransferase [Thermoplasmata archaeon]
MAPPPELEDFLSIGDVADELGGLVEHAARLKSERQRGAGRATLPGKNLALVFEKPSARTRTSLEVAIRDLGGQATYLAPADVQIGERESVADVARVLSRYVDVIAYRAFRHANVVELARHASVPVVNALDDHEHPCQVVADLLTMHERWSGTFRGRRLAWIGDGNNVLHSLLLGCAGVGLDLSVAVPDDYRPREEVVRAARAIGERTGARLQLTSSPEQAARGADALYTDVWVSMGEEAEAAEREAAFAAYQVNARLLGLAAREAFVLHDLPAHRGKEITDDVLDGPRSAAWDQAENRLHAAKAIFERLLLPPARPDHRSRVRPLRGPRGRRRG